MGFRRGRGVVTRVGNGVVTRVAPGVWGSGPARVGTWALGVGGRALGWGAEGGRVGAEGEADQDAADEAGEGGGPGAGQADRDQGDGGHHDQEGAVVEALHGGPEAARGGQA